MKGSPATSSRTHGEFIASVCSCLSPLQLKDWSSEGVIHYRDICFFIWPDQSGHAPHLSVVIDLGEIAPNRRLDAYRHMAAYNLTKGAPDHGVLGLNFLSADGAMHCVSFPYTEDLQPAEFARSLYGLASHALNFRASYGTKSHRLNASLSRLLSQGVMNKEIPHAR